MIFSQTKTNEIVAELDAQRFVIDMAKLAQNEHVKDPSAYPNLFGKMVICGDDYARSKTSPTPKSVDSVFVCTNENGKSPKMFFVEFKINQEKIDSPLASDLLGKEKSSRELFNCGLSHDSFVVLNDNAKYEQNKNKLSKLLQPNPFLKKISVVNMVDVHNFF